MGCDQAKGDGLMQSESDVKEPDVAESEISGRLDTEVTPTVTSPSESTGNVASSEDTASNDVASNDVASPETSPKLSFKTIDNSPEFIDMLSVVVDKTLELKRFEMPAYWRLFRESNTLTYEQLRAEAVPAPPLNKLMLHPADYRGGLFQHELVVRSVREFTDIELAENTRGTIYEIWGSAENAPLWLQVAVAPELPAGQTAESLKGKTIDVSGYFFKLQAYYPAKGKSSDRSMISPMYIGRTQVIDKQSTLREPSNRFVSTETMFALLVGLIILSFLVKNMVRNYTPSRSRKNQSKKNWDWINEEGNSSPPS